MEQFNSYLDTLDLSAVVEYCKAKGVVQHCRKGERIVQQGEITKHAALVVSGYFKITTLTDAGEEQVVNFTFPGEMIMDFYSSMHGRPAEFSISAGIDSEVLKVPLKDAKELLSPSFHDEYKSLFMMVFSRLLNIYRKTPSQRYKELVEKYPHIIEMVSLKDIASFLMVTPTHLSRIRSKIQTD